MGRHNAIIAQLSFSVFIWWWCCYCCCCFFLVGVATAADDGGGGTTSCSTGTVQDDCVSASDENEEFFFCTDRYSWEWSQEVAQLPKQASDSLCLTMDSNVIPDLEQTQILVLGGCDAVSQNITGNCGSLSNSTRSYNQLLDRFEEKQVMPTERFRAAAVNASEHVYLFGGRDLNGSLTCNVDRYNVLTGEWTELDTVQETHCYSDHAGVASGNDTIYLFGGYTDDYSAQNTVVKVEVSGDDVLSFSTVEPMAIARGDHVCVGLPATAEVLCIGGFTETDFNYTLLSSVESFDLETEQWEEKADMVNPRADFGAGLLNGRVTVVGGEDEERKPMDDVEWYDPEENCWTDSGELFDLPYKRLRYCAATIQTDQRIIIFGGQAADEVSDEVYAIKDTVNWYQEDLVDQLSPNAAAPSYRSAIGFALTTATGVASACLLAFHSHY